MLIGSVGEIGVSVVISCLVAKTLDLIFAFSTNLTFDFSTIILHGTFADLPLERLQRPEGGQSQLTTRPASIEMTIRVTIRVDSGALQQCKEPQCLFDDSTRLSMICWAE